MGIESNLRDKRIKQRLEQKELADYLGITPRQLCRIESQGSTSLETALRLSAYFKCTVNDLFRITDF